MSRNGKTRSVAVIGLGPRGLGALEALVIQARQNDTFVSVTIFDPFNRLGAGPNYSPDQSKLCILNIPIRALDIDPPAFLAEHIAPFPEWSSANYQEDDFPPRSDLGAYLTERFEALVAQTTDVLDIKEISECATGIEMTEHGWRVSGALKTYGPFDEILMSLGQPETAPDPQLGQWLQHSEDNALELVGAYPANVLINAAQNWTGKSIAVRGLGLSTFDVLRMLTVGLGGKFDGDGYVPSGREPRKILPFSLDGQPPAAKPATAKIDALFDPSTEETQAFKTAMDQSVRQSPDVALHTICEALTPPTERIMTKLGAETSLDKIEAWLDIERDQPGGQETDDALDTLTATIEMAHGLRPPNIGYVIGQLWRKWQNELRASFNPSDLTPETARAIVGFDEGLKRFSYGPPVTSSEELLCLIKHGLVSLCVVDDPDVILERAGWQLLEADDALFASVMVDAVLPSPNLTHVTDDLVSQSVASGLLQDVCDGLGAATRADGTVIRTDGNAQAGVCLLGRLSLGSVIAADSLHDCFGASATRWAEGFVKRGSS